MQLQCAVSDLGRDLLLSVLCSDVVEQDVVEKDVKSVNGASMW